MPDATEIPLDDDRPAPSDNELKSVVGLAREQWKWEREIGRLKDELKKAEEALKNVAERELPNLLVEIGMTQFKLSNGALLELKTETYASISAEHRAAAHKWLEDHEHGNIIKREFNIRFNRGDEAWAKKFQRDLAQRKKPLAVVVKRAVHPQTLQAWVREALAAGITVPEDIFGIFKKRVTKLTPPKQETTDVE